MDIIIPCAGLSTRFHNMRPKFLLTDYQGRMMLELAAQPYLNKNKIHIVVLQQHEDEFNIKQTIASLFGDDVNVVILPRLTSGPAETISQALKQIELNDTFLVHDCDSVFDHTTLSTGNRICVDSLDKHSTLRAPANKSYVEVNDQDIVLCTIEKKIISDLFCVGGYQFASALEYQQAFTELKNSRLGEIYISSVIDHMISKGAVFVADRINNFIDLGTKEDWQKFNDKPTIFCDIDGTLIKNQAAFGKNTYDTTPIVLQNNVDILKKYLKDGAEIIFISARPKIWFKQTRDILDNLGFAECQLLVGLHHSSRILINDFAPSNPYPSAVAVNITRNSDTLNHFLQGKN